MPAVKSNRRASVIGIMLSMTLGFVALLASIGGFSHIASEAGYSSATGTIISLDQKENNTYKQRTKNRCAPIVDFQVDGETYTSGPDQYSTYGKGTECSFSIGDEITVRYDPSDLSKSTVSDSAFDWVMGLIGGAVALVFGLIIPLRPILRARNEAPTSATI